MKTIIIAITALTLTSLAGWTLTQRSHAMSNTPTPSTTETAILGGGCFWCMQPPYDQLDGVISTVVGYSGGSSSHPTYKEISTGRSGHVEVVQITFDPRLISYGDILDTFWKNINPTQENGQFADVGSQYRTVIFYQNDTQKDIAVASKKRLAESGKFDEPISTSIEAASPFYPAEEGHQNYYQKNSIRYTLYKEGSGRADYLRKTWNR